MTTATAPWHSGPRNPRLRRYLATSAIVLAFVLAAGVVLAATTDLFEVNLLLGGRDPGAAPVAPIADDASDEPTPDPDPVEPAPDVEDDVTPGPADDATADDTDRNDTEDDLTPATPRGEDEPEGAPDDDTAVPIRVDGGHELEDVQTRLQELGYLLGRADGVRGQQTAAAVMAFQRVNDLPVDGIIGPLTLAALDDPAEPELAAGPATRLEVDLTRQLLHVVDDGRRVVTLQVSSGNGEAYRTAGGGTAYARTPVGSFRVERRIHGVRESRLGTLYDPLYFHAGFAIHGSPSVPPYPASHGCVRVTRADARWLIDHVSAQTPVILYGGTTCSRPPVRSRRVGGWRWAIGGGGGRVRAASAPASTLVAMDPSTGRLTAYSHGAG